MDIGIVPRASLTYGCAGHKPEYNLVPSIWGYAWHFELGAEPSIGHRRHSCHNFVVCKGPAVLPNGWRTPPCFSFLFAIDGCHVASLLPFATFFDSVSDSIALSIFSVK